MTPEQAVDVLDAAAAEAPLKRAEQGVVLTAAQTLRSFLAQVGAGEAIPPTMPVDLPPDAIDVSAGAVAAAIESAPATGNRQGRRATKKAAAPRKRTAKKATPKKR